MAPRGTERSSTTPTTWPPKDLVDALGELAWLNVGGLGEFAETLDLAGRSHAMADRFGVESSPHAWGAVGMVLTALLDREGPQACETAIAVADARSDPLVSVVARGQLGMYVMATDPDRAEEVFAENLRLAEQTSHHGLLGTAVVMAAGSNLTWVSPPDFPAALAILDAHPGLGGDGTINTVWLDVMRGTAMVGNCRREGAPHLVNASHGADRLGSPSANDAACLLLALAATEHGHLAEAATLHGYTETHLVAYRYFGPHTQWITERLETALAALPDRAEHEAAGAALDRRQVLALVDAIGAKVTANEKAAAEHG